MFRDKTKRPRYHQTTLSYVSSKSKGYTKISNNDTTENGIWGKNILAARIHKWNFRSVHMSRSGSRTLTTEDLKIANTSISKYFKHAHSICVDLVGQIDKLQHISCSNADVDRTLYLNVDSGICRIVPNLKQLTLNFTNCLRFSTWESSEKWSSLRNLRELNIIFNRSFDLTDQSVENLDSKLKYLDQLRKLKLVFKECDHITDGGVAALGQKIKYMSRLENLILDFSGCFHLTEPCIITLMSRILSTPNRLKQLSLGLYGCHQISDNALVLLGTYLNQNQKNLQSLALNFAGCHRITDTGLELLGTELIRQLTRLRELYFDFSWCRELTDKSLQAILSEMSPESDCWRNVVFKFPGCKMTNKIKDDVRKSWASHSKFLLK